MITKKRMSEMYELNRTLSTSIMFGSDDLEKYIEKNGLSVNAQLSIVTFDLVYAKDFPQIHSDVLRFVNYTIKRMCKEDHQAGDIKNIWSVIHSLFYDADYNDLLYPDTQKILRDHLMNSAEHVKKQENSYFDSDSDGLYSMKRIAKNVFDNDEDRIKFMLLIS